MGMILCIASSHIVGSGDIVGRSGCFKFKLSANSVMRGRVNAIRTFKGLVADLRSKKLMVEIRKKIDILRSKGIEETVIKNLFGAPDQLSRLHITSDNRIFLPDYHNMEIKMKPLPKAVFFLFLNHPEGIIFKDLPDYREELTAIYSRLSAREDNEAVLKSIEDVTDPMNNSINEKCARIREAFISQFDESLACNYFITGSRGNPKKISLSRDMIIRD